MRKKMVILKETEFEYQNDSYEHRTCAKLGLSVLPCHDRNAKFDNRVTENKLKHHVH